MNDRERQQWKAMMVRRADRLNRWAAIMFWLLVVLLAAATIAWLVSVGPWPRR